MFLVVFILRGIALLYLYYLGFSVWCTLSVTLLTIAIGAFPPMEGNTYLQPRTMLHTACATNIHSRLFMLAPEIALFLAIDLHCSLHKMDYEAKAPLLEEDKVTVNTNFVGWVEQRVRRSV